MSSVCTQVGNLVHGAQEGLMSMKLAEGIWVNDQPSERTALLGMTSGLCGAEFCHGPNTNGQPVIDGLPPLFPHLL